MGELTNNNVMATASGRVGYVVFRQVNGKLIAANLPKKDKKRPQTEGQKAAAKRFKRASRYAVAALDDAGLNSLYSRSAGKGVSPRALAMADYFNVPVIHSVDTAGYKGEPGDNIAIDAEDDFLLTRVSVSILSGGVVVESGDAVEDPIKMKWNYKATAAAVPGGITIRVSAYDTPGNVTTQEKTA